MSLLEEVNKILFNKADRAFPELCLEPYQGGWRSNKKLDGSAPKQTRPDKTVITKHCPNRLLEQGGESITYWDYVARRDNLTQKGEIFSRLCNIAGHNPQRLKSKQTFEKTSTEKEILLASPELLLEAALSFFLEQIKTKQADSIKTYLTKTRGYLEDDIEKMELGFIPSQVALREHLKKDFTEEEISSLGLNNLIGNTHKLVIPFREKGRLLSFSFRLIEADSSLPKYMNMTGFPKNNHLFNFPEGTIEKDLILVEGELDALIATLKNIPSVAALKGSTKLSSDQLELIKKANPKRVILCLDGDEAGKKATQDITDQILANGISTAILNLPDTYDLDRFLIEKKEEEFFRLLQETKTRTPKNKDNSIKSITELEELIKSRPPGLRTGLPFLDNTIRIPIGAITLIGGRPGSGKTTFLYNFMLAMIEQYKDKRFYFFTYEESQEAILLKILNALTGKDFLYSGSSNYKDEEGEPLINNLAILEHLIKNDLKDKNLDEAKSKLDELLTQNRLQVIGSPLTVEALNTRVREIYSEHSNIGAIFIDYIQKINTAEQSQDMRLRVMKISETLRNLAVDTALPLILGTQFNRSQTKEENERPHLGRMKEAANLEEDANLVLGIWQKDSDPSERELLVLKNRNGQVGQSITIKFNGVVGKISSGKKRVSGVVGKISEGKKRVI